MVYYYICELQPTPRSEIVWGINVRVFMFNLIIPKLSHDGTIIEESINENMKFILDGPTYHFLDRFNVVADKQMYLHGKEEKDIVFAKKKVQFDEFTVRALRIPEVTLIANYVINKYGIANQIDLCKAVNSTLK